MPTFPDKSLVVGLAEAIDEQGNIAFSSSEPQELYFVKTPSSEVNFVLSVYPVDVNPQFLNMTVGLSASVYNTITYTPVWIEERYSQIIFSTNRQYSTGGWQSTYLKKPVYYSSGIPQLYPFDTYTYILNFSLMFYPTNNNISFWSLSPQKPLQPNTSYVGFVTFNSDSIKSTIDDSIFHLGSSVVLVPAKSPSEYPRIIVTMVLTRQPDQTDFQILVPTVALYLFLGSSVILRRKDYVSNRLAVYIGVFIFSYTFALSLGSQSGSPLSFGYSMAERLGFALIPCAAVLAFATIIGTMTSREKWRTVIDSIAVAVSYMALYEVTQFSTLYSGSFNLFSLGADGWYGWIITLALATGTIVVITKGLFGRWRNELSNSFTD